MSRRTGEMRNHDDGRRSPDDADRVAQRLELLGGDAARLKPSWQEHADENGGRPAEEKNLLCLDTSLTPCWEANRGKTNAELSFRNTAAPEQPPFDKWRIVYMILLLHGVGTLMPWNMFITANEYFVDYKLAGNSTDVETYRRYFLSFLGFTAQIPNVILNGLNVFCRCRGGNASIRIVWSIIVIVAMFIITVILAMIDSSGWPVAFFWLTMATVVVINMANGVYQNSVYGTAAFLPMKYTNAVVLGSNLSGTIAAILKILSIASSPDPRTSAIYYFLGAIVILLLAFDTYFMLPLTKFYRYYSRRAQQTVTATADADDTAPATPPPPVSLRQIFKQCWVQYFGVFFVFFVTLSVFPAVQANVAKMSPNFFVSDKYFTPITCFLFFNFFAMVGNLATEWVRKPGPRWVWLPIVLRILFIPFLLFCNFLPDERRLPVLIRNDYIYLIGSIAMAFTSGYFSSLTMMYAPRCVAPQQQGLAGMMAAFFLVLGIVAGVLFSFPLTFLIRYV